MARPEARASQSGIALRDWWAAADLPVSYSPPGFEAHDAFLNVSPNPVEGIEKHDVEVGSKEGPSPDHEGIREKADLSPVDNAPRTPAFHRSRAARRMGSARRRLSRAPGARRF